MNWLFLRGLLREQSHWGPFPQRFVETVPDARIHYLDFPGIGTERHRPAPWNVAAMMEDTRRRWLALKEAHPGPWGLYSVSLGSMVALTWCSRHPEDFDRLVVTNTSAANLSPFHKRFNLKGAPLIPRLFAEADPVKREQAILDLTTSGRVPLDGLAERHAAFALDLPTFRKTGIHQLKAGSTLRLNPGLKTPLLVLSSLGDKLANPVCSMAIAKLLQANLVTHPWAGHDLPLEDPQWVSDQVRNWVGSRP